MSPPHGKKEKRRSSSRGRRSSIIIQSDPQCSPTIVQAPLSDSITGTQDEKLQEMKNRVERAKQYFKSIEDESEVWESLKLKYTTRAALAEEQKEELLKRSQRRGVVNDQMQPGLRPRYHLNRVLKAHSENDVNLEKQKRVDQLSCGITKLRTDARATKTAISGYEDIFLKETLEIVDSETKFWENMSRVESEKLASISARLSML